jgi:hypothetical protein
MLQCYVLTCGRSVTDFSAPPRSHRPGQGYRSPHPKVGPAGSKEAEAKSTTHVPSSAEYKNAWSYTSTSLTGLPSIPWTGTLLFFTSYVLNIRETLSPGPIGAVGTRVYSKYSGLVPPSVQKLW